MGASTNTFLERTTDEMAAPPSKVLRGALLTGWFEGSVFFAILGALNYKWAYAGLVDVADKSIAGLFTALLLGAGTSYARSGDPGTGTILSLFAILQGIGAKRAAL